MHEASVNFTVYDGNGGGLDGIKVNYPELSVDPLMLPEATDKPILYVGRGGGPGSMCGNHREVPTVYRYSALPPHEGGIRSELKFIFRLCIGPDLESERKANNGKK